MATSGFIIRLESELRTQLEKEAKLEGSGSLQQFLREAALLRALDSRRRHGRRWENLADRVAGSFGPPRMVRRTPITTTKKAPADPRVINVRLSDELRELLDEEAALEHVPLAQYIREAALIRAAYSRGRRGDPHHDELNRRVTLLLEERAAD